MPAAAAGWQEARHKDAFVCIIDYTASNTHTTVLNKYSCAHLNIITVKPTSITSKRSQCTHGYNMCLWWRRRWYSKRIDSRKATTTTMYMHGSKSQKTTIFSATTWSRWVCFVLKRERKKTQGFPYTHIFGTFYIQINSLKISWAPHKNTLHQSTLLRTVFVFLSRSYSYPVSCEPEREKNMAQSFGSNNLMLMYTNAYVDIRFLYHSIGIIALPIIIIIIFLHWN